MLRFANFDFQLILIQIFAENRNFNLIRF